MPFKPRGETPVSRAAKALEEARTALKEFDETPEGKSLVERADQVREMQAEMDKLQDLAKNLKSEEDAITAALAKQTAEQEQQREAIEAQLESLRIYAQIQDQIARGRKEAGLAGINQRFEDSETANLRNERDALLARAAQREEITGTALNISAARDDLAAARAAGDVLAEARAIEQMRAMGVRTEEIGFSILQRKLTLEAEITAEKRKQTEETSKNLLLSDREGQLQAAMAERFAQQRGRGFSAEEFQFLDQGLKGQLQQTNQDLLPPELRTNLQKLSEEYDIARQELLRYSETMAEGRRIQDESNRIFEERIQTLRPESTGLPVPDLFQGLDLSSTNKAIEAAGQNVVNGVASLGTTMIGQFEQIHMQILGINTKLRENFATVESRAIGTGAAAIA